MPLLGLRPARCSSYGPQILRKSQRSHSPEELLIIQKEFDGFEDTRERLDLLALDKEGRLVLIENKLDDTGRTSSGRQ